MTDRLFPPAAVSSRPAGAGSVGVILLDSRVPRLPGDIGHPDTFEGRALYRRIRDARAGHGPDTVSASTVQAVGEAARMLEADGARVIATGFDLPPGAQARLRAAVSVPVLTSALMVLPLVRATHGPTAHIGILTFDSRTLTPDRIGLPPGDATVVLEGMELSRELYPALRENRPTLDAPAAEADAALAAQRLRARAGGRLDAVILECSALGPFATRVRHECGAPVFDLATLVRWVDTSLL